MSKGLTEQEINDMRESLAATRLRGGTQGFGKVMEKWGIGQTADTKYIEAQNQKTAASRRFLDMLVKEQE